MPQPDMDEDWLWVLERRCPDCGFDASTFPNKDVSITLSATVPRWRNALTRPDAGVRPEDGRWSVLECSAYVRDLCKMTDERLRLMLVRDNPTLTAWNRTDTDPKHYANQDPARVAAEVAAAVTALALHLGHVDESGWSRTGQCPERECSVDTLARRTLHEVLHHLHTLHA